MNNDEEITLSLNSQHDEDWGIIIKQDDSDELEIWPCGDDLYGIALKEDRHPIFLKQSDFTKIVEMLTNAPSIAAEKHKLYTNWETTNFLMGEDSNKIISHRLRQPPKDILFGECSEWSIDCLARSGYMRISSRYLKMGIKNPHMGLGWTLVKKQAE